MKRVTSSNPAIRGCYLGLVTGSLPVRQRDEPAHSKMGVIRIVTDPDDCWATSCVALGVAALSNSSYGNSLRSQTVGRDSASDKQQCWLLIGAQPF